MNDIPSREPGKPRFLAGDDPETKESTGYRGRFLNNEPQKEPAPEAAEDEPIDPDFTLPLDSETTVETDRDPLSNDTDPFPDDTDPLADDTDLSFLDDLDLPPEALDGAEEPTEEPKELTEEDQDFQELFQAEQPQEEAVPIRQHPAKKGRPRNRTGEGFLGIPNILVTLVWIAITVAIGITLGRMAWVCAADVLAFGREDKPVTLTVTAADDIDSIADKLQKAGLIRYPGLFKLYCSFAVDDGEIQPGIWDLNALYDYHALVNMMSPSSQRSVVTVMIPEGYSCRQIFELLQEKRVCTVESLADYLFPDTYEFYTNDSPANVLGKMLGNFDKRVDDSLREKLTELNAHISDMMRKDGRGNDYISSHQFTMADVVTVASLIEKETASADEGYTVASVIYNRLFAWHGTPSYLNIDASVIYALDGKTDLTAEDLQVDSPYNTYTNTGLTPGPITNPGLSSIEAALEPQDTDYYYYVLDPETGVHHFSRTLEEHEAFRASIR